ncbi:MAG: tetratricopeptide repeat protein, partial [Bacteroidota bacterium]
MNTLLVFILAYVLSSNSLFVAFFTSMVFGIHPMHVESVAWISERKDVLHAFFYLCALLVYYGYHLKGYRSPQWYVYTLVFFILSLLSKATAVTLPIVMVLCDLYWKRKLDKRAIIEKIPFFVLSLVFGLIAVLAQSKISMASADTFSVLERLIFSSYGFISYLLKFIWPANLSAFYPYPALDGISFWYYVSPVFVAIGLFFGVKSLRSINAVAFGWWFFIVSIALVLQFVSVGSAIMAERYSYLPYVGLSFSLAFWINTKSQHFSILLKSMIGLLIGVFLVGNAYLTYQRNKIWKNSETLWTDVINTNPEVPVAYKNRGTFLAKNGRNEEALQDFNRYLELNPKDPLIFSNRGNLFSMQGKY